MACNWGFIQNRTEIVGLQNRNNNHYTIKPWFCSGRQSRTDYLTGYEPGMIYISVSLNRDVIYVLREKESNLHKHILSPGYEPGILPLDYPAMLTAENVGVDPNTFHSTSCFQDSPAGRCSSFSIITLLNSKIYERYLNLIVFTTTSDCIIN